MTPVSQYWFTFGHFCRKARALSIFGHERDNIMLGCSWHFSRLISWLLVRLLVLWALGCNRLDWWFVDPQTPSFSPSLSNISFRSRDRNSRGFSGQLVGFTRKGQRSKLLSVRLKRINVQCFLFCQIFNPELPHQRWFFTFSVKMNFPQSLKNLERSFLFRTLARRISFIDACGQIWEIEGRSRTQSCSGKFHSAVCWFLFWTMPNLGKLCWETRWNWFETQVYQLDWALPSHSFSLSGLVQVYILIPNNSWFSLLKYQYLGKQGFAMRGLNFSPL